MENNTNRYNKMVNMYEQGANAQQIAEEVGICLSSVKKWFARRSLDFSHIKPTSKFDEKSKQILSLYECGRNCEEIAEEIGEDRRQLAKWLARKGMDFSHAARKNKLIGKEEEIISMFNNGCGSAEMAKNFGVTQEAIQIYLRKRGMRFTKGNKGAK